MPYPHDILASIHGGPGFGQPYSFTDPEPILPHVFVSNGISENCGVCGQTKREMEGSKSPQRVRRVHIVDGFEAHLFQFDPDKPQREHKNCRVCGRSKDHANHQDFSDAHANWEKDWAAHQDYIASRRAIEKDHDRMQEKRRVEEARQEERWFWIKGSSAIGVVALAGGWLVGWLVF